MITPKKNPNQSIYRAVSEAVAENDGYCPCELVKNADTKCPCKAFREQTTIGQCHCGRYVKVEENR